MLCHFVGQEEEERWYRALSINLREECITEFEKRALMVARMNLRYICIFSNLSI